MVTLFNVSRIKSLALLVALGWATQSPAITVVSNVIEDFWLFNGTNRNELIMNNTGTNAGRFSAARFDTDILSAQAFTDPTQFSLSSATLTLVEQTSRNDNNGTMSGRIGAAFYNTLENADWSGAAYVNDGNSGSGVSNQTDGWFGNSGGRPGRLGGTGPAGAPNNVDERSNGNEDLTSGLVSPATGGDGVSWVDHTFTLADDLETATIDLTAGGATLDDIQSILADWVAGNNAGLVLTGEFGNQSFWGANAFASGASVGSTIDGDSTFSGTSIEEGNGQGGPSLFLTLEFGDPPVFGDVDGDLDVDANEAFVAPGDTAATDGNSDFDIIQDGFFTTGLTGTPEENRLLGDISGDGNIEWADFRIWKDNFTTASTSTSVPEPTSLVIVGVLALASVSGRTTRRA